MIEGATLLFVQADHLNRPVVMYDGAQAKAWAAHYEPFGAAHSITGPAANDNRFPGQMFQLESGLAYNWHRHYDATTGRYTQADLLGLATLLSDGPSVYGYAGQSPLMWVDEEGNQRGRIGPMRPVYPSLGPNTLRLPNGAPPRPGLPPHGVNPPGFAPNVCSPGQPTRLKPRERGEQSLFDPKGGEWRWNTGDRWHSPHWDYNSHSTRNSSWENIPAMPSMPPLKNDVR